MEGVLWKWTNYWSAWQPRWFILDNGVLAYYKSQEEVNQGCKGSIKMTACEILVHPTDNTRLDLVIPSEQHFYLKAATAQERQQWLVALGSAKACLNAGKKKNSAESNPDSLKSKKSELRLYCDLLMQQVHTVKSEATQAGQLDIEKLNEATSLLSATCDTFIKTLEDCVRLANANFTYELPHQHITDSALPTSPVTTTANSTRKNSKPPSQMFRSNSADRPSITNATCVKVHGTHNHRRVSSSTAEWTSSPVNSDDRLCPNQAGDHFTSASSSRTSSFSTSSISYTSNGPVVQTTCNVDNDVPMGSVNESLQLLTTKMETFFSTQQRTFADVVMDDRKNIPTVVFLEACSCLTGLFDLLGMRTFGPVKMDMNGNIRKIRQKYESDPVRFAMLQSVVLQELESDTTRVRNSATDALLWLKRGVEFIHEFFVLFLRGDPDLTNCTTIAYSRTLRPYHSWVVRGVFAVANKAIPYRQDFILMLAQQSDDTRLAEAEQQVYTDCAHYITHVAAVLKAINQFYSDHDLDCAEVVG